MRTFKDKRLSSTQINCKKKKPFAALMDQIKSTCPYTCGLLAHLVLLLYCKILLESSLSRYNRNHNTRCTNLIMEPLALCLHSLVFKILPLISSLNPLEFWFFFFLTLVFHYYCTPSIYWIIEKNLDEGLMLKHQLCPFSLRQLNIST